MLVEQFVCAVVVSPLDPVGKADPFAGKASLEPFACAPSLPTTTGSPPLEAVDARLKLVNGMAT